LLIHSPSGTHHESQYFARSAVVLGIFIVERVLVFRAISRGDAHDAMERDTLGGKGAMIELNDEQRIRTEDPNTTAINEWIEGLQRMIVRTIVPFEERHLSKHRRAHLGELARVFDIFINSGDTISFLYYCHIYYDDAVLSKNNKAMIVTIAVRGSWLVGEQDVTNG
jgi:hypothetical protein